MLGDCYTTHLYIPLRKGDAILVYIQMRGLHIEEWGPENERKKKNVIITLNSPQLFRVRRTQCIMDANRSRMRYEYVFIIGGTTRILKSCCQSSLCAPCVHSHICIHTYVYNEHVLFYMYTAWSQSSHKII